MSPCTKVVAVFSAGDSMGWADGGARGPFPRPPLLPPSRIFISRQIGASRKPAECQLNHRRLPGCPLPMGAAVLPCVRADEQSHFLVFLVSLGSWFSFPDEIRSVGSLPPARHGPRDAC